MLQIVPAVNALSSYVGAVKPLEFYFHFFNNPVRVAGLETKYVMNTTKSFGFLSQQDAFSNSFFKPVGLPKIVVNFYLYPNLAAPVTVDGIWQVFLWVNGSAYKPTGFALQFKEITVGGTVFWDSGQINPFVTSSIGGYIDVPVQNYNLSTILTHTFTAGTTLLVLVEVNPGSSTETRIWFDSPFYPSKVILPAKDYARPVEVRTYAYDNSETNLFYYNWSQDQRIVTIRANITDPFGGYDIKTVRATILDPVNNIVAENVEMVRKSDGQWPFSFSHLFETEWSYPSTSLLGNYTVKVSVIDNNGYYRYLEKGQFEPFIEYFTSTFTIGIVVYYNPAFRIVDDTNTPLQHAQVYIQWPNGSKDVLPRYTSINGFVNLTHVLPADYRFTVLWKDAVVNQSVIHIDSDGPYTIRTEVYKLTINVVDNTGAPVNGAYIIIYAETGVGYGLAVSDKVGQGTFRLPKGTYDIELHYSATYWLSSVTTSLTEQDFSVNASTSKTITLDYPPPIWSTIGFWLIAGVIAAFVCSTILIIFTRRRRISHPA